MTFREFLEKRRVTYDASGDFANEALENTSFSEARSWDDLNERVGKIHDFAGVEAARLVWQAYLSVARKAQRDPMPKGPRGEKRPADVR